MAPSVSMSVDEGGPEEIPNATKRRNIKHSTSKYITGCVVPSVAGVLNRAPGQSAVGCGLDSRPFQHLNQT